jgi:hypothetical protein
MWANRCCCLSATALGALALTGEMALSQLQLSRIAVGIFGRARLPDAGDHHYFFASEFAGRRVSCAPLGYLGVG